MQDTSTINTHTSAGQIAANKVLRNTYMLLGSTLAFSALSAGISMSMGIGQGVGLILSLIAMALIWFVLPKTANSASGVLVVFAFTGLIGAGLGPMLNHYLKLSNGGTLIIQALGGTAAVFIGLSAYVLTTGKNFNFLRGFIAAGMMIMLASCLFLLAASLLGFHLSFFSLALSAGIVLLMSSLILYKTSEIIHGGEANYLMATTSLFLSIVNLFTSLLQLLGFASKD